MSNSVLLDDYEITDSPDDPTHLLISATCQEQHILFGIMTWKIATPLRQRRNSVKVLLRSLEDLPKLLDRARLHKDITVQIFRKLRDLKTGEEGEGLVLLLKGDADLWN